jgi:hypothetical protein
VSVRLAVLLGLLAALAAAVPADRVKFERWEAMQESLSSMPRWQQIRWLRERSLPDPMLRPATDDTDSGLSVVGRWSYGPARSVDVRATADDTIVFLSRGSGVTVGRVRTADSLSLQFLSDINCASLTGRVMVRDSLLSVGSGGVEFYDISDLTRPALLGQLSAAIYDFWVQDTFCYAVGPESLKVYSIADPSSLRLVGASRDSGFVICVSGNCAYLGHSSGLHVIDITDPAHPTRIATIGADASAITARDTFLYVGTTGEELRVYSVANPAQPRLLGSLGGIQTTYLCLPPTCDTVIYSPWLQAVSVADPAHPRLLGTVTCPGWDYWVAVLPTLGYALVADYFEGLVAVDIRNPAAPAVAGQWWAADEACDIDVQHGIACVAETKAGVRFLDVSEPTGPLLLGGVDTLFDGVRCYSAALHDSFVFASYYYPWFRSVDVSDPANPRMAGGCYPPTEYLQALSVKDSFVYAALHYQFHVLNVARPREPRVVGTCNMGSYNWGLDLQDTFAYVGSWSGLIIVNIARPQSPFVVSTTGGTRTSTYGVAVRDSFVFVPSAYETLWVYNAADPATPYPVAGAPLGDWGYDAEMVDDSTVLVGCRHSIKLVNVADPLAPRVVASYAAPSWVRRVVCAGRLLYACCNEAGVLILDRESTGVRETDQQRAVEPAALTVRPNPARGAALLHWSADGGEKTRVRLFDALGRTCLETSVMAPTGRAALDLSRFPAGVYFVEVAGRERSMTCRFVKQ